MVAGKFILATTRLILLTALMVSLIALIAALVLVAIKMYSHVEYFGKAALIAKKFIALDNISVELAIYIASAALVGLIVFWRLHSRYKPAPLEAFDSLVQQAGMLRDIAERLQPILAKRNYITRQELKSLQKRISKQARKQQKQLNRIDRYPQGEKLWSDLDYV